ncbi:MAG: hypothetical protein JOY95_09625 [Silvibacterium sp.]|nr:hypothetical protein [Silvibacterium sp.]
MLDFDPSKRPALYDRFQAKVSLHAKTLDDYPLLDALLPILEYTPKQLGDSPFLDSWLSASVRAEAALIRAEEILKPFGIWREDLLLLLHALMRRRLKEQKAAARKRLKKS